VREIVEHPGSAVIIPVLDEKKPVIVLIRQYRYAVGKWLIELPAGTKDKAESALACAKREIVEETGYKAAKIKKIASLFPSAGMMTEKMDLFLATGLSKAYAEADFDEQIKVFTATLDAALAMIRSGKIQDAKTIAGIYMLKDIFFSKNTR